MNLARTLVGGIALAGAALAVPSDAARAQSEPIVFALPSISVLFLADYVAEDSHLWENQGLAVKVMVINGMGAINAVIAKSADFSMSTGPGITRAYARGQKLIALATALDQSGIDVVVRKDVAEAAHFDPNAPLATRAQILKGRTLSIDAVGAIPDVVLRAVARSAGITPDEMVLTPMMPTETLAAFARRAIDGFGGSAPYVQQVVLNGTGVMVSDAAKGEPTEFSPVAAVLVTLADSCSARRSVCEKIVQGVVAATRIIRNQPSDALAILKARFGTYDDKVLEAAYEMIRAMTPDSPATTPTELGNGELLNIAAGFMKPEDKLGDYDALIDNEFVK